MDCQLKERNLILHLLLRGDLEKTGDKKSGKAWIMKKGTGQETRASEGQETRASEDQCHLVKKMNVTRSGF